MFIIIKQENRFNFVFRTIAIVFLQNSSFEKHSVKIATSLEANEFEKRLASTFSW